jgi:hypothetical protein
MLIVHPQKRATLMFSQRLGVAENRVPLNPVVDEHVPRSKCTVWIFLGGFFYSTTM